MGAMWWLDYWPFPWRLYGAIPVRVLIALCLLVAVAVLRFDIGQFSRPRRR